MLGTIAAERRRLCLGAALVCTAFGAVAAQDEQAQIDFANGLFVRGFNVEAASEYRGYLREFPEGAHRDEATYRLGEAETALENYTEALKFLDAYLQASPTGTHAPRARLRKGQALYRLKRFDEAMSLLRDLGEAVGEGALQPEVLYHLGKAHYESGDTASGVEVFQRLVRLSSDSPFLAFGGYQLAYTYLERGELEKAAVQFSEVANRTGVPDALRMESRFKAAEAYDKIGWFDSAVQAYRQLAEAYPDSAYARRASYGYAWSLYHAGKYHEAQIAAQQFIEEHAESEHQPGLEYLIGNCLQQRKEYAQSIAQYAGLRARFPESDFAGRAQHKQAWVLYFDGQQAAAREELETLLKAQKAQTYFGDATFLLGTLLMDAKAYEDAHARFSWAHREYPKGEFAAESAFKAAECMQLMGRTVEAAAAYGSFLRDYPAHALRVEAALRAGDAVFSTGDYAAAAGYYEEVVAATATDVQREEALYRLGMARKNSKQDEESVRAFEAMLKRYPESTHAAEANVRIGDHLLRAKDAPLDAIARYDAGFRLAPQGPFAGYALRGVALARFTTKDVDGATEAFLRVVREYPEVALNEGSYVWLGQRLFDAERWEDAERVFAALLDRSPDYTKAEQVAFRMGESQQRSGQADKALATFERVAAAGGNGSVSLEAKFRMATLYEKRGDPAKAMALYLEAANANNGDIAARARFRIAEMLESSGDYDAAAKNFMRVAILFLHAELSPEALWRAGRAFEQGNNLDQARKTYREVVSDYADTPQAGKAQQRLEALGGA